MMMQQFPTLFPIAFIFVIFLVFPFCWKNDGIATAKLTSTFSDINKQHDHYHYNLHGRNNNKNNKYSSGVFGIDVSLKTCQDGISLDTWKCLVKNGFQFAIVEVWNGGYQYNSNLLQCVQDAREAGMKSVDVYAFMCPNCRGNNPASNAVDTIINNMKEQGINYGQLWFDVEQCKGCWNTSLTINAQYVHEAVNRAVQLLGSDRIGLYSSKYEWERTVGSGESGFNHLPQWYAHYDRVANFSDTWASQFGGWTKPSIKQYYDHGPAECKIDVDVNWRPSL